jgi:membrane protease subunit (stomatin/prohibitin family)
VWFVNRVHSLDVKWGTASPIQLQDPKYGVLLPVRSYGQFGIRIADSRKFLVKLVGAASQLDRETLLKHFRGLLLTRIHDLISTYLIHKKISVVEVNAWLDEISGEMRDRVAPLFREYGVEVLNFFVNSINVPEEDPAVAELKKTLTERAKMEVLGYSYQQMRSFDALEKAASNEGEETSSTQGSGSGRRGHGRRLRQDGGADGPEPFGTGFLPDLGKCGAPVSEGARFCSGCGPRCPAGPSVPVRRFPFRGMKFCPECGMALSPRCPSCGKTASPGAKFCPECGTELTGKSNPEER